MIGAEIFRRCLRMNGSIEHLAHGHAIHNTAVNSKADDLSRELIHYHQTQHVLSIADSHRNNPMTIASLWRDQ